MVSKKILIAAANYWTSPYHVGSHHYAKIFAKNNWEVLFISDPISPFHFLSGEKSQVKERFDIYKQKTKSKIKNIKIYVPFSLFTPNEKFFFNSSFVSFKWQNFTIPNVLKYIKKAGFENVDILWFDSISQYFLINSINYKRSIFRMADRTDSFKKVSKSLKKAEDLLLSKVDYIFYTAKTLKSLINQDYINKSFYLPNGVDFEHFKKDGNIIPKDFNNIPKPIAIYIGAIDEWFDIDLLFKVAGNCPDISFVIIGSPKIIISKLENLTNVYFLGKKDYNSISNYLNASDVGIIPFDVKHPVVNTVNPIKLYEYFSCGLPVVSTKWKELEELNTPAFLSETSDSFSSNLNKAINTGKRKIYIDFALKNSWENRFKEIISIL